MHVRQIVKHETTPLLCEDEVQFISYIESVVDQEEIEREYEPRCSWSDLEPTDNFWHMWFEPV